MSMFNIGSCNIRGLNGPPRYKVVKTWIKSYNRHSFNVPVTSNCCILVGWDPKVYSVICLQLISD